MSVFGQIVTGRDVETAVEATLDRWLSTYLAEMERKTSRDPGSLPRIGYWIKTNRFPPPDEISLPAGIIVSPGLSEPSRRGDGSLDAWWRIQVLVAAGGPNQEVSDELAKLYGAAIRTLLLQHGSLGGFASRLELAGEGYDAVPSNYLPVGAVTQLDCDVLVNGIGHAYGGPAVPAADPITDVPPDPPAVTQADIDIQVRSLT